jgi:Fe-Mn family superoxide dismutase
MENNFNNGRRKFLTTAVKGTAAISIGLAGISELLSSCNPARKIAVSPGMTTGYEQKPLPYRYDALENIIDATTMEIHYTKHASGYTKNLNDAAKAEGVDMSKPVEDVLKRISKYSAKLRNNAGGHYNHEMFWRCMRPKTSDNRPTGTLLTAIERDFSSFANFKSIFSDAGKNRFGSGWAWLYVDGTTLKVGSTPNQDNPLMDVSDIKGFPLLGLDVWEHAYYLKYQNKRPDYIDNWWNVVNWAYIQQRYESAQA